MKKLTYGIAFIAGIFFVQGYHWYIEKIVDFEFESTSDSNINKTVEWNLPDLGEILRVYIPSIYATEDEWLEFYNAITSIKQGNGNTRIWHRSPFLGFLAYLAKNNPSLIMDMVDEGKISMDVFGHLVQMGLLNDWYEMSSRPEDIIRSSKIGLLRLGVNLGIDEAKERAKHAFLNLEKVNETKDISLKNLRFASSEMTSLEKRIIFEVLMSENVYFNTYDIRFLRGLLTDQEVLEVTKKAKTTNSNKYLPEYTYIEGASLRNAEFAQYIMNDFESIQGNSGDTRHINYCVICSLALTTDGLLGDGLTKALAETGVSIKNNSGIVGVYAK